MKIKIFRSNHLTAIWNLKFLKPLKFFYINFKLLFNAFVIFLMHKFA